MQCRGNHRSRIIEPVDYPENAIVTGETIDDCHLYSEQDDCLPAVVVYWMTRLIPEETATAVDEANTMEADTGIDTSSSNALAVVQPPIHSRRTANQSEAEESQEWTVEEPSAIIVGQDPDIKFIILEVWTKRPSGNRSGTLKFYQDARTTTQMKKARKAFLRWVEAGEYVVRLIDYSQEPLPRELLATTKRVIRNPL